MNLSINDKLPNTALSQMTTDGPVEVNLLSLTQNKNVILIGMPGAFTQTCTNDHLPSLIRNSDNLFKNGIDEIICIIVNDVHVAKAWGDRQNKPRKASFYMTKLLGIRLSFTK